MHNQVFAENDDFDLDLRVNPTSSAQVLETGPSCVIATISLKRFDLRCDCFM